MPQFSAHFPRITRSFCSLLWSFRLLISRYNKQSSAKSLTDDLTASDRSFMWQRNSSRILSEMGRKLGHEIQCHKVLYHVNKEKDPQMLSTWRAHINTSRLKSISWTPNIRRPRMDAVVKLLWSNLSFSFVPCYEVRGRHCWYLPLCHLVEQYETLLLDTSNVFLWLHNKERRKKTD
jgi:hypothetical protein